MPCHTPPCVSCTHCPRTRTHAASHCLCSCLFGLACANPVLLQVKDLHHVFQLASKFRAWAYAVRAWGHARRQCALRALQGWRQGVAIQRRVRGLSAVATRWHRRALVRRRVTRWPWQLRTCTHTLCQVSRCSRTRPRRLPPVEAVLPRHCEVATDEAARPAGQDSAQVRRHQLPDQPLRVAPAGPAPRTCEPGRFDKRT